MSEHQLSSQIVDGFVSEHPDQKPSNVHLEQQNTEPAAPSPTHEFVGLEHPRNKIESQPNKSNPKKGRGRPPSHGLSRTPIYTSHREALRRCSDKKHPDYHNYGGREIKYLFKSVADLHAAVGDRPPGHTLDRINPDGNYEAGNVRWATAKEQANNRRPANQYAAMAQSLKWCRTREPREEYERTAKHWSLSIKCINDIDSLSGAELAFLEERHAATSLPFATFGENSHLGVQHVVLPALVRGGKCTVRVGPTVGSARPLTHRGLLEGTTTIELKANCTPEEVAIVNRFANGHPQGGESGLVYGGVSERNDNRIEGRLLAAAGRLMSLNRPSRVVLASELAACLSINDAEPFLKREFLFLPDLHLWSEVFGCDRAITFRLRDVLYEREKNRLPTVVYVEDSLALGPDFHSIFIHRYMHGDLSKIFALWHEVN
jgi:hypothetical protein